MRILFIAKLLQVETGARPCCTQIVCQNKPKLEYYIIKTVKALPVLFFSLSLVLISFSSSFAADRLIIESAAGAEILTIEDTGAYCSSGGSWANASGRAYKENIVSLSSKDAITTVKQLNPVSFTYKTAPNESRLGFIAEDVPAMVATKDRKGMSSMDVVAVLTKVVQEQQAAIEQLTEKLKALEKTMAQASRVNIAYNK